MAGYAEAAATAVDPGFVARATVALIGAAGMVAIEDQSALPDSRMGPLRNVLARNVLADPTGWGARFAWIVMYDPRCWDGTVDDALLTGIIAWTWNAVAGAGAAVTPPPAAPPPPAVGGDADLTVSADAAADGD